MLKRFSLEHGPSKESRTTTIRPPRFRRETASCREAGRLRKYIWVARLFSEEKRGKDRRRAARNTVCFRVRVGCRSRRKLSRSRLGAD